MTKKKKSTHRTPRLENPGAGERGATRRRMNIKAISLFNPSELAFIDNFYLHHRACYILEGKTEAFEIKTTATSLGTNIEIKCKCCGEKKDVSDYDNW